MTKHLPKFLSGAILLAAAGCLVGPDYQRPSVDELVPSSFKDAGEWKVAEPADEHPRGEWWDSFADARLSALMQQATTNSPTVRAAFRRVQQARALAQLGTAAFIPEVDFDPSINRSRRSSTSGNNLRGRTITSINTPISTSYEIDLWGRLRRGLEAVRADAEASQSDLENVLLALRADLGVNYFQLRALDAEIDVLDEAVAIRETNYKLLKQRFDAGDIDALDVNRAETELSSTRAERLGLQRRRAELENAIAVLVGEPSSTFTLTPQPLAMDPPIVPGVLPASLLERRPDIAGAERRMAAENARIGMAKSAYYPEVRLNASLGFETSNLKNLLEWPSRAWGFGPSVTVPLLEGGRIKSEVERTRQRYEEQVETYRGTVLQAVREVDDALVNLHWLRLQEEEQTRTSEAARRTVELARKRYDAGLVAYFEVVDAQRTELDSRQLVTQLRGARHVASIQLIRALGGGWEAPVPNIE